LSQTPRDARLLPVGLRFLPQFLLRPFPPRQLLTQQSFRLFLLALLQFRSVMMGSPPFAHLGQQLLPKRLLAQTPTAPHWLPRFRPVRLPAPLLHPLFKHPPPRRAVLWHPVLP